MERMFFELIQVSLGTREKLSRVPSDAQWEALFDEADRQAIVGILLDGIQRLKVKDEGCVVNMSADLLLEWSWSAEMIKDQNKHLDQQTAEVWKMLKEAGLEAVVLKGQGVATFYGHTDITDNTDHLVSTTNCTNDTNSLASLRQCGDIDIWVKGGYQKVCDFVQRTAPADDVAYHRFHYPIYEDTEVELHFRPTLMRNLFDDRKLARWYESFGAESFVYLEEKGFAVPSAEFNRIFLLTHIYRHFLFEGVGLRQVMDLYFVLKNCPAEIKEKAEIGKTLKSFRMLRFAEAVMWVLHTQFGLEEKNLICGMNEKEGRFLLEEIMQTGNFGYDDRRYQYKRFFKLRHHIAHGSHLLLHYPSEVLWTPIWLVYHKWWKWNKKRDILRQRLKDAK